MVEKFFMIEEIKNYIAKNDISDKSFVKIIIESLYDSGLVLFREKADLFKHYDISL